MERGQLPQFNFSNLLGTYNTPVTGAEPTGIDWSDRRTELPFTKANLPTLTLDGVSACVESFNIEFGIQVSRCNLPGCQQTILTGYEITGGMKIVAPTVSDKDWYTKVESHAAGSMKIRKKQLNSQPRRAPRSCTAGVSLESVEIRCASEPKVRAMDAWLHVKYRASCRWGHRWLVGRPLVHDALRMTGRCGQTSV